MDLRLTPITTQSYNRPNPGALGGLGGVAQAGKAGVSTKQAGFPDAFKSALDSVSAAQNKATDLQKEVQLENPKVSLEETMIAIQKAQIGFQATVNIRNKFVQAYSEIMNMQV